MRVLILGGTGLLGPHLTKHLVSLNHHVTIFHTGEHEADLPLQVEHIHSALARFPIYHLPAELTSVAPDVVVHMHPNGEQDTRIVMDTFKGVAGRVVVISSQDVYRAYNRLHRIEPGPPDPMPLTEDSPLRGKLYPYAADPPRPDNDPEKYLDTYDKILVEQAAMSEPFLPGTVLRLPMIYGPGDRQHRLYRYVKRMDDNRLAILLDEGWSRWRGPRGYVENVAWAIALAVTDPRGAGRIYNVAEPESLAEAEWVRRIADIVGWQGRIIAVPEGRMEMPYDTAQHWIVDGSLIRSELGYQEPIPQPESLRRAIAWERANPPDSPDPDMFDYAAEDAILAEVEGAQLA